MNRRLLGFAPVAMGLVVLGAAGCKGDGSLWLLLFAPETLVEPCETEITENFVEASVPAEDTGFEDLLTETQELTQSEGGMIAQITGGSEPVLVIGSGLWVGEKDGSTTTFRWNAEETSTTTQSGVGYNYVVNYTMSVIESIALDFKGNEASGTYTTTQESNQLWTESDTFNVKDVGLHSGQIPVYYYLEVDGPHGHPVGATNTAETTECESANCELRLVSSCEMTTNVNATLLVAEEEDYAALNNAYRSPGVGWGDGDDSGWLE